MTGIFARELLFDVAIGEPEQEFSRSCHSPKVPKDPPLTVKLTLPEAHKVSSLIESEVG